MDIVHVCTSNVARGMARAGLTASCTRGQVSRILSTVKFLHQTAVSARPTKLDVCWHATNRPVPKKVLLQTGWLIYLVDRSGSLVWVAKRAAFGCGQATVEPSKRRIRP